jgi:hypothetical protein
MGKYIFFFFTVGGARLRENIFSSMYGNWKENSQFIFMSRSGKMSHVHS